MCLIATDEGMDLKVTLLLPLEGQQEAYSITRAYPLQEKNLIDEGHVPSSGVKPQARMP
jgi:hypothetical protein